MVGYWVCWALDEHWTAVTWYIYPEDGCRVPRHVHIRARAQANARMDHFTCRANALLYSRQVPPSTDRSYFGRSDLSCALRLLSFEASRSWATTGTCVNALRNALGRLLHAACYMPHAT